MHGCNDPYAASCDASQSQEFQESDQMVAVAHSQCSDSEPEADTVGIYVENHSNRCREVFIWIRFDKKKLGEKGSRP